MRLTETKMFMPFSQNVTILAYQGQIKSVEQSRQFSKSDREFSLIPAALQSCRKISTPTRFYVSELLDTLMPNFLTTNYFGR